MNWRHVLIGGPPLLLALGNAVLLILGVVDRDPYWRAVPVNLSEAVALTDAAEVSRRIAFGGDPRARYWIRPGLIPPSYALGPAARDGIELTPMEAAAAARRPEIVDLLFDAGVLLSAAEWRGLACGDVDRDVRAALLRWPGRPAGGCAQEAGK